MNNPVRNLLDLYRAAEATGGLEWADYVQPRPEIAIGSLLDKINQPKQQIPQEMQTLLAELPGYIDQRKTAIENIKRAYDEDPRSKISPTSAYITGYFNNRFPHIPGYSAEKALENQQDQEKFLLDSKIAREKAILDGLDLKTFDKLYSTVQNNLKLGSVKGFSGHTVDGGSYVLNNDTGNVEWIKAPVGATKFMTSVAKSMVDEAIKQGTYNEETRKKIMIDAQNYYNLYKNAQPEVRMQIEKELNLEEKPIESILPPVKEVITTNSGDKVVVEGLSPEEVKAVKEGRVVDKTVSPSGSIVQPTQPTIPSGEKPMFKTPRQLANEKATGEGEYKVYQEYKDKLDSFYAANQQISSMEGMLESDKLNSGTFHEELNKIGGFLNYIDPKSQLAQNAGNDAAYYSKMMDLVRDKIKSLGAGTAVSNLDLIVTQKSVGDLRNTTQGNLKIMALMKLANATLSDLYNEKITYYDSNNNTFKGYKRDNTPTHAIKYRLLKNGNWAFDIEDKASWIERARAANGGKLPQDINARWKNYADNSVKNLAEPDKLLKKGK